MKLTRRAMVRLGGVFAFLPGLKLQAAEEAEELKKFKGKWVAADPAAGESTWTFDGDKLEVKGAGREYKIVVKLDPAAKPEKTIEFKVVDDSPNAKNFEGPGIYKFDGDDKLTICFGTSQRPTEFKSKEDFSAIAFELKRAK
ncbi:MAG: TIGR03067 domain-containing protein [bacterium]